MNFPSSSDIKRLIDMKDSDCGFFVLAVYSFIETYIRSKLGILGTRQIENDKFINLIERYNNKFRILPRDQTFLRNMKSDKQKSNDVRHQFKNLSKEEALAAIQNLLHFCDIADYYDCYSNLQLKKTVFATPKFSKQLDRKKTTRRHRKRTFRSK